MGYTAKILERISNGATYLRGKGVWKGHAEHCVVVEIIGSDADGRLVQTIAERIKADNEQESVLVAAQDVETDFI